MTETKSIVVLTGDGPEHKYVTNLICAHFPVSAIFVVGAQPRRRSAILQRGITAFLDKLLWRAFLLAMNDDKARQTALRAVLGQSSLEFEQSDKVIRLGSMQAEQLADAVRAFHPQVIAVYGTHKIPDAVLNLAGDIALNMHTGISPHYRGTACAFWPIVENEPEKVGATVHECTSAIDGGAIFFTGRARLCRNDNLHTIFARAVRAGAQGYVEVLRTLVAGQLVGRAQDLTIGREYRGYMRGFKAEIRARFNLARMRPAWNAEQQDAQTEL